MNEVSSVYLSLGSNLGDRLQHLKDALEAISNKIGDIQKISSTYQTSAWGFNSDDFYNICISLTTNINPDQLIIDLLEIETLLGRKRNHQTGYSTRPIDIDILLYNEIILNKIDLTIPHPRMLERKFVLVPLAEIAPDVIHPITKKTITHCLTICNDISKPKKV